MSFIKSKLQTVINNNMKNTFKTLLFISLLCGVSGADEIKSVMEGDSVTLQTDENKILTYNKIQWRFGDDLIAEISKGKIPYFPDGRFRGRLKLDIQTGSLNITNIRTIHSGDYKIEINTNTGTTEKIFTVTVYDSSSGIDPDRTEVKSVSVTEGESVTLNTDINPHGDELIVWWFRCILIAKVDKENNKTSLYPDERFKGRIHLDQTGSLIISNSRTEHTGEYKLKISSSGETKHKRFSLYVSDFPSEIDPDTTEVKSKSVTEGESVTLNTDINPHGDELIVWRFGSILIAKDDKENNKISLYPDERFKGRIHLDQTGSLTIINSRTADTGEYKLKISSNNRDTKHKRFSLYVKDPPLLSAVAIAGIIIAVLIVAAVAGVIYYRRRISELERQKEEQERLKEEQERQKEEQERQKEEQERQKEEQERLKDKFRTVFVMKGDSSVTLITDDDHIKKDYVNVYYGGTFIAQIREGKITHIKDVFSGRLELNHKTGSLIISNSRDTDAGIFLLKIKNSTGEITYKRIIVTVSGDEVIRKMVKEGNSVCLYTGVPELQKDAEVELRFKNTVIAEKQQKDKMISLCQNAHEDFRGRLEVDKQTGSLTITDITMDQSGKFELKIISRRATLHKKFKVTVFGTPPRPHGKAQQPADGVKTLDLFNIEADDGVNESAGLLNNDAADDEVDKKQRTSPV